MLLPIPRTPTERLPINASPASRTLSTERYTKVVDAAAWATPWFLVVSVTVIVAPGAADEADAPRLETIRSGRLFGFSTLMVTDFVALAPRLSVTVRTALN